MGLSFQFRLSMEMMSNGERGEGRPVFFYFATELKPGEAEEPSGLEIQGSSPEELARRMKAYMGNRAKVAKTEVASWQVQGLEPDGTSTSRINLDNNSREQVMKGITLVPHK